MGKQFNIFYNTVVLQCRMSLVNVSLEKEMSLYHNKNSILVVQNDLNVNVTIIRINSVLQNYYFLLQLKDKSTHKNKD